MASKTDFLSSIIQELNLPGVKANSFSKEEEASIYKEGFHFYNEKAYKGAEVLFKQLILSNPFEEKFWKGFAGSLQMQKKYLEALHAWAALAILDKDNPLPHFHAAECYMFLEDVEEAKKALNEAEEKGLQNEQMEILKMVISHVH